MPQFAPDRFGHIKDLPPSAPGQSIGLLGGSFNPPHSAHRQISEIVLKRLGLDQVWWLVTPGNPMKARADLAPLAERLVLCRAMAKNPRIEVTAFERELPAPYTAATLAFLKRRSPLVRFVWIMGADNLALFHRWRRWREILTMVPVVVVDRPGWRLKAFASKAAKAFASSRVPETRARGLATMPPPAWTFLTGPLSHVSSTDLRRKERSRSQAGQAAQAVARKPQMSATTPAESGKGKGSGPRPQRDGATRPKSSASEPPRVGSRAGASPARSRAERRRPLPAQAAKSEGS